MALLRLSDSFMKHAGFLRQHPRVAHNLRRTRGGVVGTGTALLGSEFDTRWCHAVAYRGGVLGIQTPLPRNSEGPPKSCQTQPDCKTAKNCRI